MCKCINTRAPSTCVYMRTMYGESVLFAGRKTHFVSDLYDGVVEILLGARGGWAGVPGGTMLTKGPKAVRPGPRPLLCVYTFIYRSDNKTDFLCKLYPLHPPP